MDIETLAIIGYMYLVWWSISRWVIWNNITVKRLKEKKISHLEIVSFYVFIIPGTEIILPFVGALIAIWRIAFF